MSVENYDIDDANLEDIYLCKDIDVALWLEFNNLTSLTEVLWLILRLILILNLFVRMLFLFSII